MKWLQLGTVSHNLSSQGSSSFIIIALTYLDTARLEVQVSAPYLFEGRFLLHSFMKPRFRFRLGTFSYSRNWFSLNVHLSPHSPHRNLSMVARVT